jgi:hypothetical protein
MSTTTADIVPRLPLNQVQLSASFCFLCPKLQAPEASCRAGVLVARLRRIPQVLVRCHKGYSPGPYTLDKCTALVGPVAICAVSRNLSGEFRCACCLIDVDSKVALIRGVCARASCSRVAEFVAYVMSALCSRKDCLLFESSVRMCDVVVVSEGWPEVFKCRNLLVVQKTGSGNY